MGTVSRSVMVKGKVIGMARCNKKNSTTRV